MKRFVIFFLVVLFIFPLANLQATSYLTFWVNGSASHTLTQGDQFAWEFDVKTPGSTANIELYLDLDASHTLTGADLLLQSFGMADGEVGQDGPGDSSSVPDGIVYTAFGPFGFHPQNYVLRVVDTDQSSVTSWFTINAMASPAAQITGKIHIEGLATPNTLYENTMINASGQGMFSGLTDNQGNYTINLPVAGATWHIEALFYPNLSSYIQSTSTYELQVPGSGVNNIDFYFILPSAWVYGQLLDQDGLPVSLNGWISCRNNDTNEENQGQIQNGHYSIPVHVSVQGSDSTNYCRLDVNDQIFFPQYLAPQLQDQFPVSMGDSLEKNIVVYATNSFIYGYVYEQSGPPSQSYQFMANSDSIGYSRALSNTETGYFELPVRSGKNYYVSLNDDPQWGTPIPAGYVINDGNWRTAHAGETVYFNLIPAQAALRGSISFDPGDPVNFDYDHNHISVWDLSYTTNYGTRVTQNNNYMVPVLNGSYSVRFEPENNNYLAMPVQYDNISAVNDTIDTLNFMLNYGHARLTVKLINAPIPQGWNFYSIQTQGNWPNVYSTGKNIMADSTFHFNICEGNWSLITPFYDPLYEVFPHDTLLQVTEQDSSFYIEFVYRLKTGIADQNIVPQKMYLKQNYPNPFNPSTQIEYGLAQAGHVKLTVYNLLGQVIEVLVDSRQNAGIHRITWQPARLASGIYLYRMETEKMQFTKKLVLVR
jgi:hypothetical protein